MNIIEQASRALAAAPVYSLFRRMVGTENCWRSYLGEYARPATGEKVLDLGCGPADVLEYLPPVQYTGIDISAQYIEAAKKRFGATGKFLCEDLSTFSLDGEQGSFDLVLATGVVHHLADEEAQKLFTFARFALRPHGRLVTFDGCYAPGQSRLAKWILSKDRGKFVRTVPNYARLAEAQFAKVQCDLREDLLRIPYTHLIMRCYS